MNLLFVIIESIKKRLQLRRWKKEAAQYTPSREGIPFEFDQGISEQEFRRIVVKSTKRIKRIRHIFFDGPVVTFTVESQSGISDWDFVIDFNDFGNLTGSWWITFRGNYDSMIPNRAADAISAEIERVLYI